MTLDGWLFWKVSGELLIIDFSGDWRWVITGWRLTIDAWRLAIDSWRLVIDAWLLTIEARRFRIDSWWLAINAWRLAIDAWRLVIDTGDWLWTYKTTKVQISKVNPKFWVNRQSPIARKTKGSWIHNARFLLGFISLGNRQTHLFF